MISRGSTRPINLLSGFATCFLLAACPGLTGCQSSQDQRIEEAKDLIRQKQILEAQAVKPDANTSAPNAATSPTQPASATKPKDPASSGTLGLPVYPGATSVNHISNNGDGIAMELLETNDRMDSVLAFYQQQLKAATGKISPSTTEEKRDGKRTVRITMPRDDGGLQTVEMTEDGKKTVIQLMNVSPEKSAVPVPLPGTAGSSSLLAPPTGGEPTLPPPPRP